MNKILIYSFLLSSPIGIFMMKIAWDHNSQGEIYDTLTFKIDWIYWVGIGISWMLPVFLTLTILGWFRDWVQKGKT